MKNQEHVLLDSGDFVNLLIDERASSSFKANIIFRTFVGEHHSNYNVTTTSDGGSFTIQYPVYLYQYLVSDKDRTRFFILDVFQTDAPDEVWYKLNNTSFVGDTNYGAKLKGKGSIEGWPFNHRYFLWLLSDETSQKIHATIEAQRQSSNIQYLRQFLSVGSVVHLQENVNLKLVRELGAGNFGLTFEVVETRTRQKFAAKFQQTFYTLRDWQAILKVRAFEGSNKFLVQMHNASLVISIAKKNSEIYKINDEKSYDTISVIISELVIGKGLDEYILDGRLSSAKDAIRLSEEIATALITLHENGHVHTDLKPENVLVTRDGLHAKIIDFTTLTKIGEKPEITAKSTFASPEQRRGEIVTESSDIFSIGILLFFIATGYFPMPIAIKDKKSGNWEVKKYHLKFPKRVRVNFAVSSVVKKATQINPKKRYKKLVQLLDDLWLTNVPWGFTKNSSWVLILTLMIMAAFAWPKLFDFIKHGEMYASITKRVLVGGLISVGAILISFLSIYYLGKGFLRGSWLARGFFLKAIKLFRVRKEKFKSVFLGFLFLFVFLLAGIATSYQGKMLNALRQTPPSGLIDAMHFIRQHKAYADERFQMGQNLTTLERAVEARDAFKESIVLYRKSLFICDKILSENKFTEEGISLFNGIKSEIYLGLGQVYYTIDSVQAYISCLQDHILTLPESVRLKNVTEEFTKLVTSMTLDQNILLNIEAFIKKQCPQLLFQYVDPIIDVRIYPSYSAPQLKGMRLGQEFLVLNIKKSDSQESWVLILFNGKVGYIQGDRRVRSLYVQP